MLLTLTTTHQPATDLGYLLHKHPDRLQAVDLSIGKAHLFYPESSEEQTTICLLLDIDPIKMVRGAKSRGLRGFALGRYVNDRPYVASSFMSVAISKAFSTAMNGKCKDRPELVDKPIPLDIKVEVVAAPKGGEMLIRKLFEPLGYSVAVERHVLDEKFAEWGESRYYSLHLTHELPLQRALAHLYVLLPALDNDKHYFVDQNEIEKLLSRGEGWLAAHPEKEQITNRYLINLISLSRQAMHRLEEEQEITAVEPPAVKARKESLHQQRLKRVLEELVRTGAKSVLDLGCGEGKLLQLLLRQKQFERIVGTDISIGELAKAEERLYLNEMAPRQRARIQLFQGALTYRDKRLAGFDAAALVEVIEHVDEERLPALERVVFEFAKPKKVIITTPNSEYNTVYAQLSAGDMRHDDHRFEWTRAEFEAWAAGVARKYGYIVQFYGIGEVHESVGAPSQMGIFSYAH